MKPPCAFGVFLSITCYTTFGMQKHENMFIIILSEHNNKYKHRNTYPPLFIILWTFFYHRIGYINKLSISSSLVYIYKKIFSLHHNWTVICFFLNSRRLLVLAPGLSRFIAWPHLGIMSICCKLGSFPFNISAPDTCIT